MASIKERKRRRSKNQELMGKRIKERRGTRERVRSEGLRTKPGTHPTSVKKRKGGEESP